jgi:hypothetical protein
LWGKFGSRFLGVGGVVMLLDAWAIDVMRGAAWADPCAIDWHKRKKPGTT